MKVKGWKLTHETAKSISYADLKEHVHEFVAELKGEGEARATIVPLKKIVRRPGFNLVTVPTTKVYQVVVNKRVVVDDFFTVPFGYNPA